MIPYWIEYSGTALVELVPILVILFMVFLTTANSLGGQT